MFEKRIKPKHTKNYDKFRNTGCIFEVSQPPRAEILLNNTTYTGIINNSMLNFKHYMFKKDIDVQWWSVFCVLHDPICIKLI